MDDKKLMGRSSAFHKNKLVTLLKSQKNSDAVSSISSSIDKRSAIDSEFSLEGRSKKPRMNSFSDPGNNFNLNKKEVPNKEKDVPLYIYDTTPPKKIRHKRKRLDLLSCSFQSENGSSKKNKLSLDNISDQPDSININEITQQESSKLNSSLSEKSFDSDTSQKNKFTIYKPKRKLIYSCNKIPVQNLDTPKLTLDDVCKPIFLIDEADIRSSPKKVKRVNVSICKNNEFQTVSSLEKESYTKTDGNTKNILDSSIEVINNDDSFKNCMFTEIERECVSTKSNDFKPKSVDFPVPIISDESFSNFKFTEIEEDMKYNIQMDFSSPVDPENLKDLGSCDHLLQSADSVVCDSIIPFTHNNSKIQDETTEKSFISEPSLIVYYSDSEEPKTRYDNSKSICSEKELLNYSVVLPKKADFEILNNAECLPSTSKEHISNFKYVTKNPPSKINSFVKEKDMTVNNEILNESLLDVSTDSENLNLLRASKKQKHLTLTEVFQTRGYRKRKESPKLTRSENSTLFNHSDSFSFSNSPLSSNTLKTNVELNLFPDEKILHNYTGNSTLISDDVFEVSYLKVNPEKMDHNSRNLLISGTKTSQIKPVSQSTTNIGVENKNKTLCTTTVSKQSTNSISVTDNKAITDLINDSNFSLISDNQTTDFIFSDTLGKNVSISNDSLQKVKHNTKFNFEDNSIQGAINFYENTNLKSKKSNNEIENFTIDNKKNGFEPGNSEYLINNLVDRPKKSDTLESELISHIAKVSSCDKYAESIYRPIDITKPLMFSTAGGKDLSVSEETLNKMKSKFADVFDDPLTGKNEKEINKKNTKSIMFSTAGEKNLSVSEETLTRKKSKFADICDEKHINKDENEIAKKNIKPIMFSTAGGRNLKVSEETLSKMKSKYADVFDEPLTDNDKKEIDKKNIKPIMFSTACGRNLNASDEALSKVNSKLPPIFDDTDMDKGEKEIDEKNIKPIMFSTACGRNLNASDEVLSKVNSKLPPIFDDTDIDKGEKEIDEKNIKPIMFSTACGRNLSVSNEALSKVKSKFADVFDEAESDVSEKKINKKYGKTEASLLVCDIEFKIPDAPVVLSTTKNGCAEVGPRKRKDFISTSRSDVLDSGAILITNSFEAQKFNFSTAGGKNITVSENALALVRSNYNEVLETSSNAKVENISINHEKSIGNIPLENDDSVMLCTRDQNVHVMDFAAIKSKYKDTLEKFSEKKNSSLDYIPISALTDTKREQQFSTSRCESGIITEGAARKNSKIKKVREYFSELRSTSTELISISNNSTKDFPKETFAVANKFKNLENTLGKNGCDSPKINFISSDSFSFSTATGKTISVSEEALSLAKAKFYDIDEDKGCKILEQNCDEDFVRPIKKIKMSESVESSSVNDRIMSVLKETLTVAKSQINNILEEHENLKKSSVDSEVPNQKTSKQAFTFSTASGNNITVSEAALSIARSKFNDMCDDLEHEIFDDKPVGGKVVPIPKSEKSNHFSCPIKSSITDNSKNVCSEYTRKNEEGKPVTGFSFSSASGKNCYVSEDALVAMKSKFSDLQCPNTKIEIGTTPEHTQNTSFPKDDEKNVKSIEQVKSIFSDEFALGMVQSFPFDEGFNNNTTILEQDLKLCDDNRSDTMSSTSFTESDFDKIPEVVDNQKSALFSKNINQCLNKTEYWNSPQSSKKNIDLLSVSHIKGSGCKRKLDKKEEFLFTQSISQSLLNEEANLIEKKITDIVNVQNAEEEKDLWNDTTRESDLSLICEVTDSAAAFMADCTPKKSIFSSPSSFFNRTRLKPERLLDIDFDDDDDIMAEVDSQSIFVSNTDFSYCDTKSEKQKLDINSRFCPLDIKTIRYEQRSKTDMVIKEKKKNRPKSSPGLYISLRNSGKIKSINESHLKSLSSNLNKDQLSSYGLTEDVINVSSNNAADFKFCAENFFSCEECFSKSGFIEIGNEFSIILSDDNKIGLEEITRAFLSYTSVDPSLVNESWVKNHFRWIVWKLASYERSFPDLISKRYLTPENVLHQLKFHYDREIDLTQRSALKKILECDEPSTRRLVACVADIRNVSSEEGESIFEMEMTDGWYSVWSLVDPAMANLIHKRKVDIGTKLIIHAAELLNCSDGCDPLEISDSVRLKIHTNCARRVKWNIKMGFTKCPGPIRVSLNSIYHNGGLVGLTSAVIARVYPLLYMSKDANGKTAIRNAQAENYAASLIQNNITRKSEELYEELLPEIEKKYKTKVKYDRNNIKQISNPEMLWKIISNESDPSDIQALLSTQQLVEVKKYHDVVSSKIREEVQNLVKDKLQEIMPLQKTKCLLKLRLVDPFSDSNVLLTVWNPSEDLRQLLVEKSCFDFYGLNATGMREKIVQLSNTNRTIYKENKVLQRTKKYERKVTPISDIMSSNMTIHFGEMDVVGIVIHVKEPEKPWGVTNVYLSDTQENFLMITFWTSLKTFGCEDILKPSSVVACVNLQWRHGSGSFAIPSTYANELTCFSSNSNQEYLHKEFQHVKSYLDSQGCDNFMVQRKRELMTFLKEREYTNKTPLAKGVDTPSAKRVETPKVMKRLENLKRYGDASPLPKVALMSSPDIYKKFKSPKTGS